MPASSKKYRFFYEGELMINLKDELGHSLL